MNDRRNPAAPITDRRGVVLVLAMMIVSLFLAAGLYIANRALQNFLNTRNLHLRTVAYYAAETGIERSLFIVKRGRADPTASLCTGATCNGANDVIPLLRTLCTTPCTLGTATYRISSDPNETASLEKSITTSLKQNQSITFGFFPPDVPGSLESGSGIPAKIKLTLVNTAGQDSHAWVEVHWAGFTSAGGLFSQLDAGQSSLVGWTNLILGSTVDLVDTPGPVACTPSLRCPYNLVTVRALFADLLQLTIQPLDASDVAVKIPNRVLLTAYGSIPMGADSINAIITASTSWRLSASNLIDYTIFSEKDITK